jgi:3-phenylpropionate/trans-cinnamate dioxygenase ferredoxin subunit
MAGQITCPLHGACFDLRTGTALSGPAVAPLRRFEARIEGDRVEVRLPAE